MAEKEDQLWEVVGGGDQGGILVRAREDTSSKQEDARLRTGALVREIEQKGNRLHYALISGSGPEHGWVSLELKGKPLLVKSDAEIPAGGRSSKSLLQLADVIAARGPAPETWWHSFWNASDEQGNASAASVSCEPPSAYAPRTGVLPYAPRPNAKALPRLADFSESTQAQFRQRPTTPYARMFCFYGCGDSAGQWMHFIDNQPSWCEVIVYESKAHGVRQREPWDRSYEERGEDCWENLKPALEQHALGGCAEGAPFAFYAHSAGICLMILIAMRLRAELGLEPTVVYVADQRAPHYNFLNATGSTLIADDGAQWLKIWFPQIGEMYEAGGSKLIAERWLIGHELHDVWLRWCEKEYAAAKQRHIFHCPIFVFRSPFHTPPKDSEFYRIADDSLRTPEANEAAFNGWKNWTSKECKVTEVGASHMEIWYHFDTEQPIWRSLNALADIHSRLPKKDKKKTMLHM